MSCCTCCKKRKNSNTVAVESIATITPCHHNNNAKLKELETVINEVINQLNSYYTFQNKTQDEVLTNIHALVVYTAKKYDLIQQEENN